MKCDDRRKQQEYKRLKKQERALIVWAEEFLAAKKQGAARRGEVKGDKEGYFRYSRKNKLKYKL